METGKRRSRTFDMRQQNVVEYHIDDFKKTEETADVEAASVLSVASARGLDQNLVYEKEAREIELERELILLYPECA